MAPLKNSRCPGPAGEAYECSFNGTAIVFKCYTDSTCTLLKQEAEVLSASGGMNFKVNSAPMICCDRSDSKFKGRIYIGWSDIKNGEKNEDVFLTFSDDKGKSWCEPVLLTWYPNHKMQMRPYIYCDARSGKLYVVYYDARNYPGEGQYDVVLAVSDNGGLKFNEYKLNDVPLGQVHLDPKITFNGMENKLSVLWFDLRKSQSDRYFVISDTALSANKKKNSDSRLKVEKSYRFSKKVSIKFSLSEGTPITAVLTKPLDPSFIMPLFADVAYKAGNNTVLIDTQAKGLKKGSYTLILYYVGKQQFCWITE